MSSSPPAREDEYATHPDIHDLRRPLLAELLGELDAPLQVARHAATLKAALEPAVCESLAVRAPGALLGRLGDPFLDLGLQLLELDVQVGREALGRGRATRGAARLDELEGGLVRDGAVLALVSTGTLR